MLLAALSLLLARSPPSIEALRHFVFDGYQRLFALERTSAPALIVDIDEESLARYGQWPWPRTHVAELIERIGASEPGAIALDLLFPEPDRYSPDRLAAELASIPPAFSQWLRSQPSSDERLARSIAANRVVVAVAAQRHPSLRFPTAPAAPPTLVRGSVRLDNYAGHIQSLERIDAPAAGRGLINSGPADQVVRRVPYVAKVQGAIVPSLAVEALRVAIKSPPLLLQSAPGGYLEIRFGEAAALIQEDGTAWLRVGRSDPSRYVPAWKVMKGSVDAERFRNKVVLVGNTGLGLLDYKTTPLGEFVPGVELHAQVVENLVDGVVLRRPAMADRIEAVMLLAGGLLLAAFIPRLSALAGINLVGAMVLATVGAGVVAFRQFGVLLDPLAPSLGLVAIFGSLVVGALSEAERQRRQLRDQAARMAGEVDAARRIQMGLLPDPRETLAAERRFRLAATLEPARTVGGDFYDCFMVDADRLFFAVADVSGKGLPAALFMASVKSHLKSAALRGGDVGDILNRAQADIDRENPEQLFVTTFAAIFDAQTGELAYSNAGHEPPFVRSASGAPERFGHPGGPPLCVIPHFAYRTERRTLSPGSWICVVTDGATEAMNRRREFFGLERLRTSLGWLPDGVAPEQIVGRVREDVARFAGDAEIADDITLLALRWDGEAPSGR